jgi:uncharacterized protein
MRIVFDTVVLVRSLLDPYGWSGTLLFDEYEAFEWVVSPEIVAEYLEVLQRPYLAAKYRPVENRDLQAILARIATATVAHPTHILLVCRDPEDDKFLAAAQAGSARFIVSEDLDLLDLGSYEGIEIVRAEAFLQHLGQER